MSNSQYDDAHWRATLSPEQYRVCRQGGTERPFSGDLNDEKRPGSYVCVCCGAHLFDSQAKFDSGSGWPSFTRAVNKTSIREIADHSFGMQRIETRCANCDAHLGHVFPDGPKPTGLRYCINSAALGFTPKND